MKDKKKVLVIAPLPPPINGQSVATKTLVNSKLKEIFDVSVINLSAENRTGKSGTFSFLRMLQLFRLAFVVLWRCVLWKPDAIYLTISQSPLGFLRDVVFINMAGVFKKKCVIHLHGGYFRTFYEEAGRVLQWLIRVTLAKVDRAVVLADSLRNIFERLIESEKIRVIPNCVPDEILASEVEVKRKLDQLQRKSSRRRVIKVLFLSNLIKSKGYFDLLRAARILVEKGEGRFQLNLAGAFPSSKEEQEAQEFVKQYGLEEKTKFHGVVIGEKKRRLLMESDVFVLPTYYQGEGQPISILEAMSFGLPIITTKYRGIPSMVINNENGFFVSPKSPRQIADAISNFIQEPRLIYEMGKANFKKVHISFSKERYIVSFIRLFNEVLRKEGQSK